jgi:hypothetical protein
MRERVEGRVCRFQCDRCREGGDYSAPFFLAYLVAVLAAIVYFAGP